MKSTHYPVSESWQFPALINNAASPELPYTTALCLLVAMSVEFDSELSTPQVQIGTFILVTSYFTTQVLYIGCATGP